MNQAGVLASLCFPSFPRFCGQVFYEAQDRELALLCVQAYNDFAACLATNCTPQCPTLPTGGTADF